MTKPNLIPEKIAILIQAKEEIRKGNATGLCSAIIIGRVELKGIFTPNIYEQMIKASQELGTYVRTALAGHKWLGDWQKENWSSDRNSLQLKQDRMDWIDWMINCYREDLKP